MFSSAYISCSGLYEGYNDQAEADQKLDWFSFDILNGNGDMLDLLNALDPDNRPDFAAMSKEEIKNWVGSYAHNFEKAKFYVMLF